MPTLVDRLRWHLWQPIVRNTWCRIFGHRDDWYDGPLCTRCGVYGPWRG